jgi:hypothetical protein
MPAVLSVPIKEAVPVIAGPSDAFKAQLLAFLKQLLPEMESLSDGDDEVSETFTFTCEVTEADRKFLVASLKPVAKYALRGNWDCSWDFNPDTKKVSLWIEPIQSDISEATSEVEELIEKLEGNSDSDDE